MSLIDVIRKRREITKFNSQQISSDILETIIDAAYLAPSGNNLPSREFIVVADKNQLAHLSNTTPYMKWLQNAQAAIAITGRPNISKYWLQDASIASGFIWLTAEDLGLGAAFGAVYHAEDADESERRETYVRSALNIPNDRRVVAVIGLGYPAEQPEKKKLLKKEEIVYYDTFQ